MIIVCGLQGTGKTTVAKRIAAKIGAVSLRTDAIRKELKEVPQYTEQEMQDVYDEMFSRAQKLLLKNRNVILDATFTKKRNRDQAKKIAEEAKTDFKIVKVVCSRDDIIRKRIRERSGDASEAGVEIFERNKSLFEPIVEEHIVIDNSGTLEDIDEQLEEHLK